ncbi:MAG: glycosyltransferase family 2 protein [Geminicoccaceae bacterium]
MAGELTLCVVNYNGGEALPGVLRAVCGQEPRPAAVILVDNASTDGGLNLVRSEFPGVRILALPSNDGPAAAREAAFRAATTSLVGFVDNDVTPAPDCFARLAAALAANDRAVLAMPRVLHAGAPDIVQFDGARAHFIGLMSLEGAEMPLAEPPAGTHDISSIVTACFLVDRRRWGQFRLQDPSFFIYHEDHDLGLRAGQLGYRILAVPQAVCLHGKGTPELSIRALGGYSPRRIVLIIANRWRILLTRYELRTLLLLAPTLLLFELVQLVGSLGKGWAASWLAALGRTVRDLPSIARERHEWATQRRFGDGRVLEGGPLPFHPRLLTSPLQLAAGRWTSAAAALNWRMVRRLLRDAPALPR